MQTRTRTTRAARALVLICAAGLAMPAWAQDAKPEVKPDAKPEVKPDAKAEVKAKEPSKRDSSGRRIPEGAPTVLAFKGVTVEQLVPFIVESTGKVVLPRTEVMTRTITLLNDEPIPRHKALDLIFLALQQAGVAVVESSEIITLRDINDLPKQDVPVVGAADSVLERTDLGTMVEKVFALTHASSENVGAIVKEMLPDYAKIQVDKVSNQVIVLGNIGLLQRIERLILNLDRVSAAALVTETFKLKYADADAIATNIKDLYTADARAQNQNQNPFAQIFGGGRGGGGPGGNQPGGNRGGNNQPGADPQAAQSVNLRVSANKQQNSVTVLAEQQILDSIRTQITDNWDLPLDETTAVPKVFDLQNSDAVKLAAILEASFGKGTTGTTQNQFGGSNQTTTQGTGRLAGQFTFQAIPESNRLLVFAKNQDNMTYIEKVIRDLDTPQTAGLPQIIELKHASAEELAEQINTLLALDGTLASLRRAESGLSTSAASSSPFASTAASTATDTSNQANATGSTADTIAFWWQRSRPPTDKRASSNLIGQIRVVPVWRQNALMIISPPEYRAAVNDMIDSLDRPGRQVLITGIICEVSADDATAMGLRWSSQAITPNSADNSFSIGSSSANTKNNFLPGLFDTSTLTANANLNLILQALNEKTKVNILSEPKIFTSDNQEAQFFDGKDIPFINDQTVNQVGQTTASFDYKAVGIQLKARPRITVKGDIDLQVNLQLASISPGEVVQGALVVDRRETTTHVILRGGQTIVISGILRKEESDITRKVPILGDILPWIFSSTEKDFVNKELLVFITPIIVDNTEALPDVNKPYIDRLQEQRDRLDERVGKKTETPVLKDPASAATKSEAATPRPGEAQPK